MGTNFKAVMGLAAFVATVASVPAQAQERPARYGNTASFFFYDNRNDQRDFPSNGSFPGNFASDRVFAGVGAAGWLESNPQHQPYPYPSQSYRVEAGGYVACPRYRLEQAPDRRRVVHCLTSP